jgi:hypothetical protein
MNQTGLWLPPQVRPDVPLANYIFRATDGGRRIATCRDTVPALRMNRTLRLRDWLKLEALKLLVHVEPGEYVRSLPARVLYGRWMVDCPECNGALDVDPDEPVFLCLSCGWPGKLAVVVFPQDRKEIERLLVLRPQIHTRNWFPGEPVKNLATENHEHGLEV